MQSVGGEMGAIVGLREGGWWLPPPRDIAGGAFFRLTSRNSVTSQNSGASPGSDPRFLSHHTLTSDSTLWRGIHSHVLTVQDRASGAGDVDSHLLRGRVVHAAGVHNALTEARALVQPKACEYDQGRDSVLGFWCWCFLVLISKEKCK